MGWNTLTDKLERIYYLPETAVRSTSQPNDMVVDTKHGVFVLSHEGIGNGGNGSTAALIVVDMKIGITRRLLKGSRATLPENIPTVINAPFRARFSIRELVKQNLHFIFLGLNHWLHVQLLDKVFIDQLNNTVPSCFYRLLDAYRYKQDTCTCKSLNLSAI